MVLNTYTQTYERRPNELWRRCRTMLFSFAVVIVTSLAATGWADSLYIITGTEDGAIILDQDRGEKPDISSQLISLSNGSRGYDITLAEDTPVTIRHEGETRTLLSRRESVTTLLGRLRLTPGPLEMVGVNLSASGVELTVSSDIAYYEHVTEKVTRETIRVPNPKLPEGTEQVTDEGADGIRSSVYEVTWSNGQELSRQFVEQLDTTARDRVVEYGTAKPAPAPGSSSSGESGSSGAVVNSVSAIARKEENADGSGTLYLKDGTVLNYSGVRSMTATAYTAGHGGVGTRTASGTAVHVGTVAVDKSVIPLGTRMYIVADGGIVYGLAVAEDTGVRGNKVDLYYDTYNECIQFGRRGCTVYILV